MATLAHDVYDVHRASSLYIKTCWQVFLYMYMYNMYYIYIIICIIYITNIYH